MTLAQIINMEKFKTQISKPESLPVVRPIIEINEETTQESQVEQCQKIMQAKLEAILSRALNAVNYRIKNLALIDGKTYIHEIEAFKVAMANFYQEVQFLKYDAEYGLNDKEDRIAVPFKFKGEAMDRLSILEAVTSIMKYADDGLQRVHNAIAGFEEKIQEARERLADAELEDSEKDQAIHQSTITNRSEKKDKQEKRKDALVKKINAVLKVDPNNTDELMAASEQLLSFLIRNKWIKNYISMDQAKTPTEMLKKFDISKLIEETEEEAPTIPARITKKPNLLLNKAFAATAVAGLIAIAWVLFSQKDHGTQESSPSSRLYQSTLKVGKTRKVEVWRFSPGADIEDEDKIALSLDNGYRIVETAMSGAGISPNETEILAGKAPLTYCNKSHLDPIANETYILNYKEEILSTRPMRSRKHPSGSGYLNAYLISVRRTMIVQTKYEGNKHETVERPLTVTTTYSEEVYDRKPVDTKHMQYYSFDNKNKDLDIRLGKDENGKTILSIKRKDGRAFRPVNSKKKK